MCRKRGLKHLRSHYTPRIRVDSPVGLDKEKKRGQRGIECGVHFSVFPQGIHHRELVVMLGNLVWRMVSILQIVGGPVA